MRSVENPFIVSQQKKERKRKQCSWRRSACRTRSLAGHLREFDLCPRAACEYHVQTMFVLLQEGSRSNITAEVRKFTAVDRREALKMGDLLPSPKGQKVVRLRVDRGNILRRVRR